MHLISFRVKNYRSVVDSGDMRVERLQALVGENNAGKSNLLYALQVFLTPGAGGVGEADFFDPASPMVFTATFGDLTPDERRRLRPYLRGDTLALEKRVAMESDRRTGRLRPAAEYHGYIATPRDWWLSVQGVIDRHGERPKWEQVASEHGLLEYVRDASGRVNKASYEAGLQRMIIEREDIEFDEPELGQTQALGLQPVLVNALPSLHLLPAITDYSDEVDRRSSSTNFQRLMGDLADRILKSDPRFVEVESSVRTLAALLNAPGEGEKREEGQERLAILGDIEHKLQQVIARLMPSVSGVHIQVSLEGTQEIFRRGVSILVDDGRITDVLVKGHGLQRCVVFGLLQALILNQRGQLVAAAEAPPSDTETKTGGIILAIEEPELYIHPQMQRLIYSVLQDFSRTDQVIYSTHSPAFVDVAAYEAVAVVRKDSVPSGSYVCQCAPGVLDAQTERKTFQFLASFGLEQNQMFFAKQVILVEGGEDIVAVLATGRETGEFREFPEEVGRTLVATGGKQEMPKYMKLLNAFRIPYVVLQELDGEPESAANRDIGGLLLGNRAVTLPRTLEDAVGHEGHFPSVYHAKKFFENPLNITDEFKGKVKDLFA